MKTVSISDLKDNMSRWIEEVKKGKSIMVTSYGQPVAVLSPMSNEKLAVKARLKTLRKTAKIGDILSPIEDWKIIEETSL